MAQFIVISVTDKDRLMSRKAEYQSEINGYKSDIEPVEIMSGEFILPLSVLDDPAFQTLKARIIADGNGGLIVTREVLTNEFIPPSQLPGE